MEERRLDPPWHKLEEQCTGSKVDERNGTGTRGYAKDANNISSARCTRCPKERTVKFALQNSTIFHSLPLFQLPPFFSFFFFSHFPLPFFLFANIFQLPRSLLSRSNNSRRIFAAFPSISQQWEAKNVGRRKGEGKATKGGGRREGIGKEWKSGGSVAAKGVERGDGNNSGLTRPMSRRRRNGQRRNSCVMYAIRERGGTAAHGSLVVVVVVVVVGLPNN